MNVASKCLLTIAFALSLSGCKDDQKSKPTTPPVPPVPPEQTVVFQNHIKFSAEPTEIGKEDGVVYIENDISSPLLKSSNSDFTLTTRFN